MPVARPTMLASAIGELNTRSDPNSICNPAVSLKTPPLPLTSFCLRYSSRLQSATSSPKITMRSSRRISSRNVALIRSAMVLGAVFLPSAPLPRPWTPPAGFRRRTRWDQGSANTYTAAPCRPWVLAPAGRGQPRSCRSSSTCFSRRLMLFSSRMPSRIRNICMRVMGSRWASRWRSTSGR